jgi:undecaprenyl pyrophosphate phosphatase UppP
VVRPHVPVGSVAVAIPADLSVRFLTGWFATRTRMPFAIYLLIVGTLVVVWFS